METLARAQISGDLSDSHEASSGFVAAFPAERRRSLMSFWSTEKVADENRRAPLIQPFSQSRLKHGAYELALGRQAYVTSMEPALRYPLGQGVQLAIPPGQFAVLLTEETVSVPNHAIGMLSMKLGVKQRGLVNVSGFHVDPGFVGKLTFSVFNAGNTPIILESGHPVFLLWYCDLDRPTSDVYNGTHNGKTDISCDEVGMLQGKHASPHDLAEQIAALGRRVNFLMALVLLMLGAMLGVIVVASDAWRKT
jgi:dCTP deaminase